MPRLRRSDPSTPGLVRTRRGRGFSYLDTNGSPIRDQATLDRIAALAIPPAWKDVWISPHPNGHLQAVGTDDAGRRQYLYHEHWAELRGQAKFDRMLQFARSLEAIRSKVDEVLATDEGATRERVIALAVRLLDRGYFRIGSEQYVAEHGTYGLLTLRRSHIQLEPPGSVLFDFPAKHGIRMQRRIEDDAAFTLVQQLRQRRAGKEARFFSAQESRGRPWVPVDAADVNDFLQTTADMECSAKDFRTWHGTVLCAIALASQEAELRALDREPRHSDTATKREISTAIKQTATYLGNTPAVARSAYIDPRVFDRYRDGRTIQPGIERLLRVADIGELDVQLVAEAAALRLLEDRTPATIARAAAKVIEQELATA